MAEAETKGFFGQQLLGQAKDAVERSVTPASGWDGDLSKLRVVLNVLPGEREWCRHWGGGLFRQCQKGIQPIGIVKQGEKVFYQYQGAGQIFSEEMSSPCNRRFNFHNATCQHADFSK